MKLIKNTENDTPNIANGTPKVCKWNPRVANGTPKGCKWFVFRISQWGLPNTYSVAANDTKYIWNSLKNTANSTPNLANGPPKSCKWNPGKLQMAPQKVANGLCSEFHNEDCPTLTALLLMIQNAYETHKKIQKMAPRILQMARQKVANETQEGCKWHPKRLQMLCVPNFTVRTAQHLQPCR